MNFQTFLTATSKVYNEEIDAIKEAKSNPQTINYLVGKIMQYTKGECKVDLAQQVCKLMVKEI